MKTIYHYVNDRNFNVFPDVEILCKRTVSVAFSMIRPNISGICSFPQNFHNWKLGEIMVFYPVSGFQLLTFFTQKKLL